MADAVQNGTIGGTSATCIIDGQAASLVGDDPTNFRHLFPVRQSEEVVKLQGRDFEEDPPSRLPRNKDVRSFHHYEPELVLPHKLLRDVLTEDYRISAGQTIPILSQRYPGLVALGLARGPQYRLHECILSVPYTTPEVLHMSLLEPRTIVVTAGNQSIRATRPSLIGNASSMHRFNAGIQQISVCEDDGYPYILIRTGIGVHVVTIEFKEGKKHAHLRIVEHFTTPSIAPPTACTLTFNQQACLSVSSKDGILRLWSIKLINVKRAKPEFTLALSVRVPYTPVHDVHVCSLAGTSSSSSGFSTYLVLLTSSTMQMVMTAERQVKVLLRAEKDEVSRERDEIFRNLCVIGPGQHERTEIYSIVTSTRILFVELDLVAHNLTIKASRKHYRNPKDLFSVTTLQLRETRQLILHSRSTGFCSVYDIDALLDSSATMPYRLNLGGRGIVVALVPCAKRRHTAAQLSDQVHGFFLLTQEDTVVCMSCSTIPDATAAMDRSLRQHERATYISDDLFDEEEEEEEDKLRKLVENLYGVEPEYDSTLDLSSLLSFLVDSTSSASLQTYVQQCATSYPLKTALELPDAVSGEIDDLDSTLATIVSRYRERGQVASTTPGLRPRLLGTTVNESDGSTAAEIEQLLQAWAPKGRVRQNESSQMRYKTRKQQIRKAAALLTPSLMVFSECPASDSGLVRVADLCSERDFSGQVNAKTVNRIFEGWKVGEDVTAFVPDMFETTKPPLISKVAIQEIPKFAGKPELPPQVMSSQAVSSQWNSNSQAAQLPFALTQMSNSLRSEDVVPFAMTQPVPGKFGGDRQSKKRKKAGF